MSQRHTAVHDVEQHDVCKSLLQELVMLKIPIVRVTAESVKNHKHVGKIHQEVNHRFLILSLPVVF